MYTFYSIGSQGSRFRFCAPEELNWPGYRFRFQDEIPAKEKTNGATFLVMEDKDPHEVWVVRRSDEIFTEIQAWNEMPEHTREFAAAIGVSPHNPRLANNTPGFKGSHLLMLKDPHRCTCGKDHHEHEWPRWKSCEFFRTALYSPKEFWKASYPQFGQPYHKQVSVDSKTYFIQAISGFYHVFTSDWVWLGKFKFFEKAGERMFETVSMGGKGEDTSVLPSPFQKLTPLRASSVKGTVRLIASHAKMLKEELERIKSRFV